MAIGLMQRVATEITARGLDLGTAARQIGVSLGTLKKHLDGEHVRSDSALKYQDWIDGRVSRLKFAARPDVQDRSKEQAKAECLELPSPPTQPQLVVDLFAGCGGLSLGFDLLGNGRHFETILAIDIDPSSIRVFNKNSQRNSVGRVNVGRQIDLTEFSNACEFLTFYVGHAASVRDNERTLEALSSLSNSAFLRFRAAIAAADQAFLRALSRIWCTQEWRTALAKVDRDAFSQTSVAAFHDRLKLPRAGNRTPILPQTLWDDSEALTEAVFAPANEFLLDATLEWEGEFSKLQKNRESEGRGQLAVSARRVAAFANFIATPAFAPVRDEWISWRARRCELRALLFGDPEFYSGVRQLYQSDQPVTVLVGGPPCQGFSRIGRGKIRSLKEAKVHAHGSAAAGDARNLLFNQYVMILEALRPEAFLFENVQHFQSTVRADDGDFQATEILEEAIANISGGIVSYSVASAVLNASRYGIPQNRIRYFMCGIRSDQRSKEDALASAEAVLTLPRVAEVPMSVALAGLLDPQFVGDGNSSAQAMGTAIPLSNSDLGGAPGQQFLAWVRQSLPGTNSAPKRVDSHAARGPRPDDAAFFTLLGPGQRWMDYRADNSSTVLELRTLLEALARLPDKVWNGMLDAAVEAGHSLPDRVAVARIARKIDGSLPIRLLLEQIGADLGFDHHLLKESYLEKRDGQHGDWLSRMDLRRPAKTMVSHMSKDTYGFIHPNTPRTISVREAARIQSFPDWFSFSSASLTEAFKMIGNAVPPLLSNMLAGRVAGVLLQSERPVLKLVGGIAAKPNIARSS